MSEHILDFVLVLLVVFIRKSDSPCMLFCFHFAFFLVNYQQIFARRKIVGYIEEGKFANGYVFMIFIFS